MKRNKESACRQKIICTYYLNKREQALLDRYVEGKHISYKAVWAVFRRWNLLNIRNYEPYKKLCLALKLFELTASRAGEMFSMLGGEAWND